MELKACLSLFRFMIATHGLFECHEVEENNLQQSFNFLAMMRNSCLINREMTEQDYLVWMREVTDAEKWKYLFPPLRFFSEIFYAAAPLFFFFPNPYVPHILP